MEKNKKIIILAAVTAVVICLIVGFVCFVLKKEEPPKPRTMEDVLRDLTAPVNTTPRVISPETLKKLSAPAGTVSEVSAETLRKLSAPR